jgi:hypothetical protein
MNKGGKEGNRMNGTKGFSSFFSQSLFFLTTIERQQGRKLK